MKEFKAGKTYTARSIGDNDCVFSFTVTRRTEKSVWIKGSMVKEETRRAIKTHDGQETIMPLGTYSMAPMLRASNAKEETVMKIKVNKTIYDVTNIDSNVYAGFTYTNYTLRKKNTEKVLAHCTTTNDYTLCSRWAGRPSMTIPTTVEMI